MTGKGTYVKPRKDYTGQRFGRLVVLGDAPNAKRERMALFLCDCGARVTCALHRVRYGSCRSCGCLQKEGVAARSRGNEHGLRHGHARKNQKRPGAYSSWSCMLTRCTNPKTPAYKDYGGRGITVCERWKTFENFLEDLGERPEGMSLDRIDPDGNYEPGNVRWGTRQEQTDNRRVSRVFEMNGERRTLSAWAALSRIPYGTIRCRLKRGMRFEEAIQGASCAVEGSRAVEQAPINKGEK